jgi:hypothetical protein
LALPKLQYQIIFWTVNTTDQKANFGLLGYQFNRKFNLYGGLNALPGTRSLQGSHPYWLGHDRVMADEFFRPYFSNGVWANGEVIPGLWYNSNEYLGGVDFYLADSRNYRINAQVIRMNRSPVSSSFGYYVGGQKGVTVALAMSIFF